MSKKKAQFLVILVGFLGLNLFLLFEAKTTPLLINQLFQFRPNGDFFLITVTFALIFGAVSVGKIIFNKKLVLTAEEAKEIIKGNNFDLAIDFTAGFLEEVFFRWLIFYPQVVAYCLTGINLIVAILISAVVSAVFFASLHLYQGKIGVTKSFVFALAMNFLSLGMGLFSAIVVHTLHNWLIQLARFYRAKKSLAKTN